MTASAASPERDLEPVPETPDGSKPFATIEIEVLAFDGRDSGEDHDHNFDAFYLASFQPLVSSLLRMGATTAEAEDVAQQAMLVVYTRWSEIESPMAFARVVAENALIRLQRRQRSRTEAERLAVRERSPTIFTQDPALASDGLDVDAVMDLMKALPPMQQKVMALYVDGFPLTEIASVLGIAASSARVHLYRARQLMVRELSAMSEE